MSELSIPTQELIHTGYMPEVRGLKRSTVRRVGRRNAGFTLLEMMVSLGLLMVMLAIIFVPLTQAFQVFNIGRSTADLQAAADQTVKTIAADLERAVVVYPNAALPGVTDKAPYSTNGVAQSPYYSSTCGRVDNTSRIDFVLPQRDSNDGTVEGKAKPAKSVVTYYARLLDTKTNAVYDPYSNPLSLYRAQMPYTYNKEVALNDIQAISVMPLDGSRYPATGCGAPWLRQEAPALDGSTVLAPGLPKLTTLSQTKGENIEYVQGSHTLVTPLNMGIAIANANTLRPDLAFNCEDVNHDGIIDRVTIQLTLTQIEEGNSGRNGQPSSQRVTAVQVVDLANSRLPV
jgi:type II secretory pathway pseudopilin PulG